MKKLKFLLLFTFGLLYFADVGAQTVRGDRGIFKKQITLAGHSLDSATYYISGSGSNAEFPTEKAVVDYVTPTATKVDNLVTLSGMAANSTHHSTFTGTLFSDNQTTKAILQAIETYLQAQIDSTAAHRTDINNVQTLTGRPDGSTHLSTFSGAIIADNLTIKAAIQAIETYLEANPNTNFANTNLTFTANRTHAGGGFDFTMTGVGTYSFTTHSGGRGFSISSSAWQANTDALIVRGVVGQSHPASSIRLYEDPDNATPTQYVEWQAPSSFATSRTYIMPSTQPNGSRSALVFDSGSNGSFYDLPGAGVLNQVAKISSSTAMTTDADFMHVSDQLVLNKAGDSYGVGITYPLMLKDRWASSTAVTAGHGVGIQFVGTEFGADTVTVGYLKLIATDVTTSTKDYRWVFSSFRNNVMTDQFSVSSVGDFATASITLDKTVSLEDSGAASTIGTATLVGGTVTVNTTAMTATAILSLQRKTAGGTTGELTYTQVNGTSFTINSASGTDTSVIAWHILETH